MNFLGTSFSYSYAIWTVDFNDKIYSYQISGLHVLLPFKTFPRVDALSLNKWNYSWPIIQFVMIIRDNTSRRHNTSCLMSLQTVRIIIILLNCDISLFN